MRLILSGSVRDRWAYLEPATANEIAALERRASQGEWSIGRGSDALLRLRRMAARLGYPATVVYEPTRRQVVVQRRPASLVALLRSVAPPSVPVIVDRRIRDRRVAHVVTPDDRRRRDRRQSPPAAWRALRFLVVPAD